MKLFDVRNQFKQQLNFNRNNINNISSEIQRRYKSVIPSQKQFSPRPGWIQERVMVSVCQPSKYPAPPDLGRLVLDPRSDSRAVNRSKTFRRNMIQEKFLVMTCKPTPVQKNIVYDLLWTDTFGHVQLLPSMLEEADVIAHALDFHNLEEAGRLRSSVLIDPWMFGPSCSPRQRDEKARESVLIEPWMFSPSSSPRQKDDEARESVLIDPWMFDPSCSPRQRDGKARESFLIEPWMFSPSSSPRQVNTAPEISEESSVVHCAGSSFAGVDSIISLSAASSVLSTTPYSVIMTPRSSLSSRSSISLLNASLMSSSSEIYYSDVESLSSHRSSSAPGNVIGENSHSVIMTPRSSTSSRSSIVLLNASLVASSSEIYYSDVESQSPHRSTSAPVIAGNPHSIATAARSFAAIETELMALMDSPRIESVHQQTSTSLCGGMEYQYQHSHFNFSVLGNQVRTVDATIEILTATDFLNEINPESGSLNILGAGVFGSVFTSKHLVTGKRVAIKAYHNEDIKHIVAEARYLQVLNTTGFTPKLLGLLPNPVDPREVYIVMEMVGEGVTLRRRLDNKDLGERNKLSTALRLVIGLHSVHEKKVLINDIKDDNIIIYGADLRAKFIDFGHASCGFEKTYKGDTSRSFHLAPEVRNHQPTTPASDVYSLGDTLGFLCVNKLNGLVYRCKRPDPTERPLLPHMAGELMVLLR